MTEYNQSGYYVAGDTIEGFQYELSQAIAQLSGLEIQIFLEMSLAESFDMLEENNCDAVARNIPITSEIKEKYLFTEPIVLDKQVLIQRTEAANNGSSPSATNSIWPVRPYISPKILPPSSGYKT